MSRTLRGVVALLALLVVGACASGPVPIHWGEEECAHCQMVISDERYAAQVVDSRGKAWKFDSIECMLGFLGDDARSSGGYVAYVADGRDGWLPAESSYFVQSEQIRSPMGGGYIAVGDEASAAARAREVGGSVLRWEDAIARSGDDAVVRSSARPGAAGAGAH